MGFVTILFGNGLGRAVDNAYFSLQTGIQSVWNDPADVVLTAANKRLVLQCLPDPKPLMPSSEDELETIHQVIRACNFLNEVEQNNPIPLWLTEGGRDFPGVTQHFIGKVANYFHECPNFPNAYIDFVNSLVGFIGSYDTHIATLNYDNLLYQPLIEAGILDGYNGHLLDGFTGTPLTFRETNMHRRRHNAHLGWYLHLHGSPLFFSNGRDVCKMHQPDLAISFNDRPILNRHIVLAHTRIKPEIISGSSLLSSYWDFFRRALDETATIIVFGYGGYDTHVNRQINDWVTANKTSGRNINLIVIERLDPAVANTTRISDWKNLLDVDSRLGPTEFELKRLNNVLDLDWKTAF